MPVANPKVPANTAAEPVALARRAPGKLTCSSAGIGGGNHLPGAPVAEAAGIALTHVPCRGTGPALADVTGDHRLARPVRAGPYA